MIDALGLVARWVTFGAILAAIGAVAFRFIVLRRARLRDDLHDAAVGRAARVGVAAAIVIVPCALARLIVQTAQMRFPDDPWVGIAARLVTSTEWGTVWMVQAAAAILAIAVFAFAGRGKPAVWAAAGLIALTLSATPTLSSHAMSANGYKTIGMAADWLHVLAAGTWLGTLGVMFAVIRRYDDGPDRRSAVMSLLAAFSPVALSGAGVIVSSGVVSALIRVQRVEFLFSSTYGRRLLIKLGAVAVVAFFGWLNWKRNTPAVLASGPAPMRAGMRAELATVAVVLLITALLVTTSPPMEGMVMP